MCFCNLHCKLDYLQVHSEEIQYEYCAFRYHLHTHTCTHLGLHKCEIQVHSNTLLIALRMMNLKKNQSYIMWYSQSVGKDTSCAFSSCIRRSWFWHMDIFLLPKVMMRIWNQINLRRHWVNFILSCFSDRIVISAILYRILTFCVFVGL